MTGRVFSRLSKAFVVAICAVAVFLLRWFTFAAALVLLVPIALAAAALLLGLCVLLVFGAAVISGLSCLYLEAQRLKSFCRRFSVPRPVNRTGGA